jgi:hypothetical protein
MEARLKVTMLPKMKTMRDQIIALTGPSHKHMKFKLCYLERTLLRILTVVKGEGFLPRSSRGIGE